MRIPHYLTVSRHNLFYLRFPIPRFLHPEGRATDLKVSLGTRSPCAAMYLGQQLTYFGQQALSHFAAQGMNYSDIKAALQQHFADRLSQAKARIAQDGPLTAETRQLYQTTLELNEEADTPDSLKVMCPDERVCRFIALYDLPIETYTKPYEQLRRGLVDYQSKYLQEALSYNEDANTIELGSSQVPAKVHAPAKVAKLLSDAIELYLEDKIGDEKVKETTANSERSDLSLLVEVLGEAATVNLDKETAQLIKTKLRRLPRNRSRTRAYRGLTLDQAIDKANGSDGLSARRVSEYLAIFNTFYNWLLRRDYVAENPFTHLTFKARKSDAPRKLSLMLKFSCCWQA